MGVNDAQEMLEAAQEECIRLERENAELLRRAERAETLNQITQQEFRQTGAVKAELVTRTKQRDELFELADKHIDERDTARSERDAALAVIEHARFAMAGVHCEQDDHDDALVILSTAAAHSPASALAKVKADTLREEAARLVGLAPRLYANPASALCLQAARIEKEADRDV